MSMIKEKPFIHLFKTIRNYYFYDVNKDTIVLIDQEVYEYLKNGSGSMISERGENILKGLREEGYLSANRCKEIRNMEIDTLGEALEGKIYQLVLQVTQACNLTCYYCPYANITDKKLQRNHTSRTMELETAKKAVDFYMQHSYENEKCVVSFYGGEPFLVFDLMKEVIEYVEKVAVGKEIMFNVTTNATLLTDEMISFLVEHKVDVLFSIDGPEKIHDINRKRKDGKGTFKIAYDNLQKLCEAYGENARGKLSVNTVLNPENDLDDVLELFTDKLFTDSQIGVAAVKADDEQLEIDIPSTRKFREKMTYQYFLGMLDYLDIVKDISVPPFVWAYYKEFGKKYAEYKKKSLDLPEIAAPGGPCIPGQRRLFVNVDGEFFPCERVSEVSEVMKIGNLKNGFDLEKAKTLLNIGEITSEKCRNCWAIRHCTACARIADGGDTLSAERKLKHCGEIRSDFEDELRDCALIKEVRLDYKI